MIRRLLLLAVLTLALICLLTRLVPGPIPVTLASVARAQEPIPVPPSPVPEPRDPATVASELLPDPMSAPAIAPQPPPARLTSQAYLNDVRGAAAGLRQQVARLKTDISTDLRGEQRRQLSRKVDDVLDALDDFEERLSRGQSRLAVADEYAAVEARMAALARDAKAVGVGGSRARDRAGWLAMADERLAEAVAEGAPAASWDPALVARECDNLVFLARALEHGGEYSLSAAPGRRQVQQELHHLTDAAEYFRASVATASPLPRLMKDFASVEDVWDHLAPELAALTRDERLLLVPRASSVEDVIVRLHRRLGLAGAPAHLPADAEPRQTAGSYGLVLPASAPR
jgi:hypothetical protein